MVENNKKKLTVIFMLSLFLSPAFVKAEVVSTNNQESRGSQQIFNIRKIIGENTPDFIAKPIIKGTVALETWRQEKRFKLKDFKEEIKLNIASYEDENVSPASKAKQNEFSKALEYVKLFFISCTFFVFNNQLVFYGFFLVVLYFIVRTIWRFFF